MNYDNIQHLLDEKCQTGELVVLCLVSGYDIQGELRHGISGKILAVSEDYVALERGAFVSYVAIDKIIHVSVKKPGQPS